MTTKTLVFDHFEAEIGSGICNLVTKRGRKYVFPNTSFAIASAHGSGLKKGDKIKVHIDDLGVVSWWDFVR